MVSSTSVSSCGLDHGLGLGNIIGVVLVLESSVKPLISEVFCECDAAEVLAISVVVSISGHGPTHD